MTVAEQHRGTRRWPALTLSGCAGAMASFIAALTPSLLPRPAFFLGPAAGVAAAIGYGLFVCIAHVAHRVGVPELPARRRRALRSSSRTSGPRRRPERFPAGGATAVPALTWVADRDYASKNAGSAEWVQPTDSLSPPAARAPSSAGHAGS